MTAQAEDDRYHRFQASGGRRLDQAIQFVAPLVLPIAASAASFYSVLTGAQVTTVPYGLASRRKLSSAGEMETLQPPGL